MPIPIWIGSWGSTAGLRRVARLADGWLASGYNTTPEEFATNALATMWLWITESASKAERMLAEVLGPAVKREPDYLRSRVCGGGADHCLDLLARYQRAGSSGSSSGRSATRRGSSSWSRKS